MDPLVFLPGMMCDARLFAPQIEALSRERAVQVGCLAGHDSVRGMAEAVLIPFHWLALAGLIVLAMLFGSARHWSRALRLAAGALTLAGLAVHHAVNAGQYQGEASWGVSAGLAVTALILLASTRPWTWRPAGGGTTTGPVQVG